MRADSEEASCRSWERRKQSKASDDTHAASGEHEQEQCQPDSGAKDRRRRGWPGHLAHERTGFLFR